MSWDPIQNDWPRYLGHARILWGKLTEDELQEIKGRREVLAEMIHRKYQLPMDLVDDQLRIFEKQWDYHTNKMYDLEHSSTKVGSSVTSAGT